MSLNHWDDIYQNVENIELKDANWMDQYTAILSESTRKPIIDLGCGSGSESIHLLNRGYSVISCDFSKMILGKLKNLDSRIITKHFDIENGLPFEDSAAHIILASLSLHYFSWESTEKILKEIKRVLDIDGYLICRLNSINDINYGAGSGIKIEKNYYDIGGTHKRFFDESSIDNLFCDWKIVVKKECDIWRYKKPKKAWEILVTKR
ncbi:MAG: methyltransferase domain-containing protein [bacterium]|nr:methyltransferase domain-containing protein [bacterium]